MRKTCSLIAGVLLLTALPSVASHTRRGPTSGKHRAVKGARSSKASASPHPRAIADERATEIQTALVKAGYLQEVTGHWDTSSQAAMQKLQADNGWQTKLIPDSRALIKLGLGPSARLRMPDSDTNGTQQLGGQ